MTTRTSVEAPAGRMEPLARLPVFFALADKRAVVAGGTAGAAWKAELLAAAGAHVADQTTVVGEIGDIADRVELARLPGPALVMIGHVLAKLVSTPASTQTPVLKAG